MNFKRIDFEKGELKTENHLYKVAQSLSVDKWQEFLIIQQEVAYGLTFEEFFEIDKEIYAALNKLDFVRASTLVYNRMTAIQIGIEKRQDPILRLCALFLIREDEDPTIYNESICKEKLHDWRTSGIDFKDFFLLAAKVVPGLLSALDEISLIISAAEEKAIELNKKLRQQDNTKSTQDESGNG